MSQHQPGSEAGSPLNKSCNDGVQHVVMRAAMRHKWTDARTGMISRLLNKGSPASNTKNSLLQGPAWASDPVYAFQATDSDLDLYEDERYGNGADGVAKAGSARQAAGTGPPSPLPVSPQRCHEHAHLSVYGTSAGSARNASGPYAATSQLASERQTCGKVRSQPHWKSHGLRAREIQVQQRQAMGSGDGLERTEKAAAIAGASSCSNELLRRSRMEQDVGMRHEHDICPRQEMDAHTRWNVEVCTLECEGPRSCVPSGITRTDYLQDAAPGNTTCDHGADPPHSPGLASGGPARNTIDGSHPLLSPTTAASGVADMSRSFRFAASLSALPRFVKQGSTRRAMFQALMAASECAEQGRGYISEQGISNRSQASSEPGFEAGGRSVTPVDGAVSCHSEGVWSVEEGAVQRRAQSTSAGHQDGFPMRRCSKRADGKLNSSLRRVITVRDIGDSTMHAPPAALMAAQSVEEALAVTLSRQLSEAGALEAVEDPVRPSPGAGYLMRLMSKVCKSITCAARCNVKQDSGRSWKWQSLTAQLSSSVSPSRTRGQVGSALMQPQLGRNTQLRMGVLAEPPKGCRNAAATSAGDGAGRSATIADVVCKLWGCVSGQPAVGDEDCAAGDTVSGQGLPSRCRNGELTGSVVLFDAKELTGRVLRRQHALCWRLKLMKASSDHATAYGYCLRAETALFCSFRSQSYNTSQLHNGSFQLRNSFCKRRNSSFQSYKSAIGGSGGGASVPGSPLVGLSASGCTPEIVPSAGSIARRSASMREMMTGLRHRRSVLGRSEHSTHNRKSLDGVEESKAASTHLWGHSNPFQAFARCPSTGLAAAQRQVVPASTKVPLSAIVVHKRVNSNRQLPGASRSGSLQQQPCGTLSAGSFSCHRSSRADQPQAGPSARSQRWALPAAPTRGWSGGGSAGAGRAFSRSVPAGAGDNSWVGPALSRY